MDTRTPAQKHHDARRAAYERQRKAIAATNPTARMLRWEEMHERPTAGVRAPLERRR